VKISGLLFYVFIILSAIQAGYSQDFHFSGFLYNKVYYNPAYVAMPEMDELSLTYRNQWPGISANFVTYGASLIHPVKSVRSGAGITFCRDEASDIFTKTSASLYYAYNFRVSREMNIYTGIQASLIFKQFNPNGLVYPSDILNSLGILSTPPNIQPYSKAYPDFSAGVMSSHRNGFSTGLSVSHLTRPLESYSLVSEGRIPLRYGVMISYSVSPGGRYNKKGINFVPAALYTHQGSVNEVVLGALTNINIFGAGLFLRQNLTMQYSSLILSAGIFHEKYTFLYSFDVNLTRVNFLLTKMSAHEVTFLYRFEYKKKKLGAVKCPEV
jgi:type IX secretion system PorP/SprF family membrane protein